MAKAKAILFSGKDSAEEKCPVDSFLRGANPIDKVNAVQFPNNKDSQKES